MEAVKGDLMGMTEKREYTVEDIMALPDGQRAELFDGEMIMMATPTTTHQTIIGELYMEIAGYIKKNKEKCKVLFAPFGVFIKKDNKNYLEPDIVVICDENKLDNKGCHGAPDWVIEVVSPSSRGLDYERKMAIYSETGVREYWIVDSEKQVIIVYHLEKTKIPFMYRFGDKVKVSIYKDLEIDSAILKEISYPL